MLTLWVRNDMIRLRGRPRQCRGFTYIFPVVCRRKGARREARPQCGLGRSPKRPAAGQRNGAQAPAGDCTPLSNRESLMLKMLFEVFIAVIAAATSSLVEWLLSKKRNDHDGSDRDR